MTHYRAPNYNITRPKDVLNAASHRRWDKVFEDLGCRLTVIETDRTKSQPHARQTQKLLDAIRKDYWETAVPLEPLICPSIYPIYPNDIVKKGVFSSLNVEFLNPSVRLSENDESKLIRQALTQSEWQTITVVLFLLIRCGPLSKQSETALIRAVGLKDWRYVTTVYGDGLKLFYTNPDFLLKSLGLNEETITCRSSRIDVLRSLFGPRDSRDPTLVALVVKSLICWAQHDRGPDVIHKWLVPLEVMEDFSCTSFFLEQFLLLNLDMDITRQKCDSALFDYVLNHRMYYMVRELVHRKKMTKLQAYAAARAAYEDAEWATFFACISIDLNTHWYIKGETALHIALGNNAFVLMPTHLHDKNVDVKNNKGLTLLHTAINRCLEDSSGNITNNINILLLNQASPSIPYPTGETVLQKIMNGPESAKPELKINLLLYCINSAIRHGSLIDWKDHPGVEQQAFHICCAKGISIVLKHLIQLGANPVQRLAGRTLIDTAIRIKCRDVPTHRTMLETLCDYPDIIADHKEAVKSRAETKDFPSNLPLIWLLQQAPTDKNRCIEIIEVMIESNVFTEIEYIEASKPCYIDPLEEADLHVIVKWLGFTDSEDEVEEQLRQLHLRQ